jgi:hypothetical protein
MDIYVCNSGSRDARGNQLYMNQGIKGGIPSYKEMAKEAGLEDGGLSTHAAFFDYDRDGDLDMYLLNNSFTPIDKLGYTNLRDMRDKLGGDKLFRNDSPDGKSIKFTDVSEKAGIYGSLIGFGLGITIGDVNNDNWPDIYISNEIGGNCKDVFDNLYNFLYPYFSSFDLTFLFIKGDELLFHSTGYHGFFLLASMGVKISD